MIIDSFLFFQELKLLKIRLEYLYDVVDRFIIVEAIETFSGREKGFIFEENKKLFKKYMDKIIYFKIEDRHNDYNSLINYLDLKNEPIYTKIKNIIKCHNYYDKREIHWLLDTYHRECIHIPLSKLCKDNYLIIFSDIDEIPDRELILDIQNHDYPTICKHKEFKYYMNLFSNENWVGSIINTYENIENKSLNNIRIDSKKYKNFYSGGYHFTSIGGEEQLINKIESWGHQEYNKKIIKNNLHQNIINGRDIFYRFGEPKNIIVDLDDRYFYDKKMSEIIKRNSILTLKNTNNNDIRSSFKYVFFQLIFYLIRIKDEPLKAFKKLLNKFKLKIIRM
tara:strand:+ start:593 stop:1600 length:1008 start_codon:yes stop_codon:yes gene_type:complete